ncbi:hypothetical protein BC477_09420 [Clavibacter michiganensis subsp. michiganensis]|uniref:Uncharacterized protein n=1 Tax=Clavibacter michiganensis subsp. michiganensis TaxID=33013 RepID=A0A251XN72_CLAMM|nr:hypothetical protein BC477_09420 [Clavibacter michiganensis subsp. michiganensis]OUE04944.1 hypothetical protein CMMCAS07_08340 [Clavibacter michiganensis subsp. michiganensis]
MPDPLGARRDPSAARTSTLGPRSPCSRITGEKAPNWNQRTSSSWNAGSSVRAPAKPPMSVVNQGMPATPMWIPAVTCRASASNVEWMSPDQTSAP